ATPAQSVALVEDDRLLAELSYEAQGNRGGMLLPTVDRVLKKAGVAARDLDVVVVSVGPGSFTGLRVGLATAKGLALGAGARLVGVPTLEALAAGYASADATICALLDAYRGEVYMALFRRNGNALERLSPDAVLAPGAVASALAAVEGPVHLIGNGAARYREPLEAALGGRVCVSDEGLRAAPTAAVVARLGIRQFAGGNKPDAEVALTYLRRVEAEVNFEKGLLKSPLARVAR
ncbi:MAG: tRNA (adenosine(37)-N6)-threonylcarbamoyltransferase complex dimerization subunit type 1 TsaB, partial [Nitrospirota bacterium]